MPILRGYPEREDFDTDEEYLEAESAYWDKVDAQYDAWKDDKLTGDD